jgi:hypothetical protein
MINKERFIEILEQAEVWCYEPVFGGVENLALINELAEEVLRLRGALYDVVNPMRMIEREAEVSGTDITNIAYLLLEQVDFQEIARKALGDINEVT